MSARTLVGAALLCAIAAPARAGAPEALFRWQLGFGGTVVETVYGLSLGYATSEHFAPLSRVVELNVSRHAALATIAGVPLLARSYRTNQSQADQAYDAGVTEKPWYTQTWVYWTLGGVAATAVIIGSAGGGGSENHTLQVQDHGSATPVNGDLENGYTVCASNAVPQSCAQVPPPPDGGG